MRLASWPSQEGRWGEGLVGVGGEGDGEGEGEGDGEGEGEGEGDGDGEKVGDGELVVGVGTSPESRLGWRLGVVGTVAGLSGAEEVVVIGLEVGADAGEGASRLDAGVSGRVSGDIVTAGEASRLEVEMSGRVPEEAGTDGEAPRLDVDV